MFNKKFLKRLKYYLLWGIIWLIVIIFFHTNLLLLSIFQIIFFIKDIIDIISKKDIAPEYFEHLPYSIILSILSLIIFHNFFLVIIAVLDSIIDFIGDSLIEK